MSGTCTLASRASAPWAATASRCGVATVTASVAGEPVRAQGVDGDEDQVLRRERRRRGPGAAEGNERGGESGADSPASSPSGLQRERRIGAPFAPRAGVERSAKARELEGEEVVAGGHARAAVDDGLRALRPERFVVAPELVRRPKDGHGAVREVGRVGRVPRTGDVAGSRVDRLEFSAVAFGRAGVEDQGVPVTWRPSAREGSTNPGKRRPVNAAGVTCGTLSSSGRPSAIHFTSPPSRRATSSWP